MHPSLSSPLEQPSLPTPPATNNSPQQKQHSALNNPFNQYNTEFIKLDVYNWNEINNFIDPNAQFTLLSPDDALIDCPMASDSINVLSRSKYFKIGLIFEISHSKFEN